MYKEYFGYSSDRISLAAGAPTGATAIPGSTTTQSDDFNRADNAVVGGAFPTEIEAGAATFSILSNQLRVTNDIAANAAIFSSLAAFADGALQLEYRVQQPIRFPIALWFRKQSIATITPNDTGYYLLVNRTATVMTLSIVRGNGASATTLGSVTIGIPGVGDTIGVAFNGQIFTARFRGASVLTVTDNTYASGSVGIGIHSGGTPGNADFDNWLVTNSLLTYSGVIPIKAQDFQLVTDSDADFEIAGLIATASLPNSLAFQLVDERDGRLLHNTLGGVTGFAAVATQIGTDGDGIFWPFIFPRPYLLTAGSSMIIRANDLAGNANDWQLTLHGSKIRDGAAPWDKQWKERQNYDYATRFTLAANEANTFNIPITRDADFLVKKCMLIVDEGAVVRSTAYLLIKDGAEGREWMDKPMLNGNFANTAKWPLNMPAPRFLPRGSNINIAVQDISAVQHRYAIVFSGEKLIG